MHKNSVLLPYSSFFNNAKSPGGFLLIFIFVLVANPCDAQESYQFFPNDVTLAIGIQHRFSSSMLLFFNFIYFMSSTKYSMHSLYLKTYIQIDYLSVCKKLQFNQLQNTKQARVKNKSQLSFHTKTIQIDQQLGFQTQKHIYIFRFIFFGFGILFYFLFY